MPKFGAQSLKHLQEAHPELQRLFHEVIKVVDCSVIEGFRSKEEQDKAFYAGKSKVKWPNSKHNNTPSLAVDVAPYPIDWNDTAKFYYFAGIVLGIASQLGIKIRFGGDWDRDHSLHDQAFFDLVHFELVEG